MKKIFFLIRFSFLFSCSSMKQNANEDYIEFNHKNYMVIKDDQINIKLIPKIYGNKQFVTVKIIYHGEKLDNKRISISEFQKIKELVNLIKNEDLEMPRIINKGKPNEYFVGILDGGNNSIIIQENKNKKEFSTTGFSEEYHKTFYYAVKKIFESLKFELENL